MNKVLLGLGSNLKCPERQIRQALNALKALPHTNLLDYAPYYGSFQQYILCMVDLCR